MKYPSIPSYSGGGGSPHITLTPTSGFSGQTGDRLRIEGGLTSASYGGSIVEPFSFASSPYAYGSPSAGDYTGLTKLSVGDKLLTSTRALDREREKLGKYLALLDGMSKDADSGDFFSDLLAKLTGAKTAYAADGIPQTSDAKRGLLDTFRSIFNPSSGWLLSGLKDWWSRLFGGKQTEPIEVTPTIKLEEVKKSLEINTDYLVTKCYSETGIFCAESTKRDIDKIVIHYTLDTKASQTIREFSTNKKHVAAHYVVDRDGTIYQLVDDKYVTYHATNYTVNLQSIGIEIVNLGWVTKYKDKFYNYRGKPYFGEVVDIGVPWKPNSELNDYQYWQPFTDEQYESLELLIDHLTSTYDIPKELYSPSPILYDPDSESVQEFRGLLGHAVIWPKKWDPGPVFDWSKVLRK